MSYTVMPYVEELPDGGSVYDMCKYMYQNPAKLVACLIQVLRDSIVFSHGCSACAACWII